jgi:hypothetical protein
VVPARAHQDAIWRRTRASNPPQSLPREYFPTFPIFLAAFVGDRSTNLAGRDAHAVLALALTPTAAARLSRTRIRSLSPRALWLPTSPAPTMPMAATGAPTSER